MHQPDKIHPKHGVWCPDPVERRERVHRLTVEHARAKQRTAHDEPCRGRRAQVELLPDRGHVAPGIERVRHAVGPQHLEVHRRQELGAPQLDGVPQFTRQLLQEPIQRLRKPLRRQPLLPAKRGKLEHQRPRVPGEGLEVRARHCIQEELGVEEVLVGLTRALPVLASPGMNGDLLPYLADAGKVFRQLLSVAGEGIARGRGVEGGVDPDGTKQRVARRFAQQQGGGVLPGILSVIYEAGPAGIGPRRWAEAHQLR